MQRKLVLLLCLSSFIVAQIDDTDGAAAIHVKSSEENSSEELLFQNSPYQGVDSYLQHAGLTPQLRGPSLYQQNQPRCGCLQVVILRLPQYQCQCGGAQEWSTSTTTTVRPTTTTTFASSHLPTCARNFNNIDVSTDKLSA
ncbi:hypothetical protein KIN20_033599 [Parelaphostrongylus tenuis]|uniref:Uncharacterized protein n=1 Tax=Parelaphostrongylus tenuis TaxID=148309 RepID=A0AAD5R8V5_PARTN|nr:hypothetical protein KIN20_033599 [Parelaphostrongylus tenuis]